MIKWAAVVAALASPSFADQIVSASYFAPTSRYPHGVLGDTVEYAGLTVVLQSGTSQSIEWGPEVVFEDNEPRVQDLDFDGRAEVIVVESHQQMGARLAIWGLDDNGALTQLASTPFIGTRFRWLAPIGAADFDADGSMEIAFVDRPHLAKTARIWRYSSGNDGPTLRQVSSYPGVTNHRIGEVDIAGGVRNCGAGPEMIVASADWSELLALKFDGETVSERRLGSDTSRAAFAGALRC